MGSPCTRGRRVGGAGGSLGRAARPPVREFVDRARSSAQELIDAEGWQPSSMAICQVAAPTRVLASACAATWRSFRCSGSACCSPRDCAARRAAPCKAGLSTTSSPINVYGVTSRVASPGQPSTRLVGATHTGSGGIGRSRDSSLAGVMEPALATRTDSTPTAATSGVRARLGRPVARTSVGPAGQRPCSPGVRCRRVRARYRTPARAAGRPLRAARLTYRPSTRPMPDRWRAVQARPARPARTGCDRRWRHAAAAMAHTGRTSHPPRAGFPCVRSHRERGQPPEAARSW